MPIPAIVGAAAISAGGGLINTFAQGAQNRKQRKWNEKMYDKQRADALSDWAMQNEYNSPRMQMQRLQEANLNPHLIYGGGSGVTEAGTVRTTDVKSWNPSPTNPGDAITSAAQGALSFYDLQVKKAQIDNLTVSNTLLKQDSLLKAAELIGKTTNNATKQFDLELKNELKETSVATAMAGLQNTYQEILKKSAETKTIIDANERAALSNNMSLIEAAERILSMRLTRAKTSVEMDHIRQQIKNLKVDEKIKNLDAKLAEDNIRPGDPFFMRMLQQAVTGGSNPFFKQKYPGEGKKVPFKIPFVN